MHKPGISKCLSLNDTDFPIAPQATEPVTATHDCSSVQLPVLQATTQNSACLSPSDSLTASQGTEQEIQDSIPFNSYASYLRGLLGRHGSVSLCRVERENKMTATYNVLAFKR